MQSGKTLSLHGYKEIKDSFIIKKGLLMKNNYTIISTALVLLLIASSCDKVSNMLTVPKPTATIKSIHFGDVSLEAATLLFDVEVHNPYPVSLPLTNLNYKLNSQGNQLLAGEAGANASIPSKKSEVVPLQANVKYLDLIRAFKDIRPGTKIPYEAQVELLVEAPSIGTLPLPISKKGEIAVPNIPKASNIDLGNILNQTLSD
jgi:LEA14-like dessication related protein